MEFDIQLTATTLDPESRSLKQQFDDQIAQFGPNAVATLQGEVGPNRVDTSGTFGFEMQRMYHITLS